MASPSRRKPPSELFSLAGGCPAHLTKSRAVAFVVHAHYTSPQRTAGMDFFKIENGKIVEHWDVVQDIPEQTATGQDMFSELS
ncbi:MAG TPA: hypothetical protein VIJ96_16175 [Acidothermaceae bacterium]